MSGGSVESMAIAEGIESDAAAEGAAEGAAVRTQYRRQRGAHGPRQVRPLRPPPLPRPRALGVVRRGPVRLPLGPPLPLPLRRLPR